jgi:hypothetical protein
MPTRSASRRLIQVAAAAIVAAVVVLGVWVAGGLLTDDFRGSVALTAVWLAVAAGLCWIVARRSRILRVPVASSYLVTAAVIGAFLASTTLRDRVVSEKVVRGIDPSSLAAAASADGSSGSTARSQNVQSARGRFTSGEHPTRGIARVVRLGDGRIFLTLTSFATAPGPDLRVRLAPSRTLDGGASDALDLGALKGNRGDQQYRIPADANLRGRAVVIWCRAFSARFGSAVLASTLSRDEHRDL